MVSMSLLYVSMEVILLYVYCMCYSAVTLKLPLIDVAVISLTVLAFIMSLALKSITLSALSRAFNIGNVLFTGGFMSCISIVLY